MPMPDEPTIYTSRAAGMRALRPILKRWSDLIHRSTVDDAENAVHWYGEVCNVGVLAAAAWCEGGLAAQEYAAPKDFKRESYSGRADVWLRTRTGHEYVAEAKLLYVGGPRARRDATISSRLDQHLRWAKKDAKHTARSDGDHTLALVFVIPLLDGHLDETARRERLDEVLRLVDRDELDIYAWAPTDTAPVDDDGYVYPGALLLGVSR